MAQVRVVLHPRLGDGAPGTASGATTADDKQLCYHVMGLVRPRPFCEGPMREERKRSALNCCGLPRSWCELGAPLAAGAHSMGADSRQGQRLHCNPQAQWLPGARCCTDGFGFMKIGERGLVLPDHGDVVLRMNLSQVPTQIVDRGASALPKTHL